MLLKCSKCGLEKEETEFYRNRGATNRNQRDYWCKDCSKENRKFYYKNNTKKENEYNNRYKDENKVRIKDKNKTYSSNNTELIKERNRIYYIKNITKIKEKIKYYNMSYNLHPNVRIMRRLRSRFNIWLRVDDACKKSSVLKLVDMTKSEFRLYIESQFTEGMNWDNIHIDHYVPLSYFNAHDEYEQRIAWNWRNLRPLFASDNLSKHNKLPDDYLEVIDNIIKAIENID